MKKLKLQISGGCYALSGIGASHGEWLQAAYLFVFGLCLALTTRVD